MRAPGSAAAPPRPAPLDTSLLHAASHRLQTEIAITGHRPWTCNPSSACAAIGRIAEQRLKPRLGYLRISTPKLSMLHINAVTGISLNDDTNAGLLADSINDELQTRQIGACAINRITTGSALHEAIHDRPMYWRIAERTAPAWMSELTDANGVRHLPITGKTLRKRRNEHKRLATALGPIAVDVITQARDVDTFLGDASAITSASYHASLGVGVRDTPLWRAITLAEALSRRLRCYALRAPNQTLAYVFGTVDEAGTYHFEATGFNPALRDHSPGSVLLWNVISDLFEHTPVQRIDFGFGDAVYKRIYATKQRTEANMQIFGTSPAARFTGLMYSSTSRLHEAAASTSLGHWLKRRWRLHLSSREATRGNA